MRTSPSNLLPRLRSSSDIDCMLVSAVVAAPRRRAPGREGCARNSYGAAPHKASSSADRLNGIE